MKNVLLSVSIVTLGLCFAVNTSHAMEKEESLSYFDIPRDVIHAIHQQVYERELNPTIYTPPSPARVMEMVKDHPRGTFKEKEIINNGNTFTLRLYQKSDLLGKLYLSNILASDEEPHRGKIVFIYTDEKNKYAQNGRYFVCSPKEANIGNLKTSYTPPLADCKNVRAWCPKKEEFEACFQKFLIMREFEKHHDASLSEGVN